MMQLSIDIEAGTGFILFLAIHWIVFSFSSLSVIIIFTLRRIINIERLAFTVDFLPARRRKDR